MLSLANKLSIARVLLVPAFIATIMYYTPARDWLRLLATGIFLLAILSDALDGYMARTKGESSKLGTFLDPLADKLLLISAYICLATVKSWPAHLKLAPWIVIIVISRDVIIVLGSAIVHMVSGKLNFSPTIFGKITTALQMLTILALLLQLKLFYPLAYLMIFFTLLSGLDYIKLGGKFIGETHNNNK
ncbi:CDP-alcohol phosphatidyltransferase family protein [Candidatus Omnitrophota bacterium]